MNRLGEISLGDIVRGLTRYWPIAGVAVVVLLVVALLPGIERPGDEVATAPPAPVDFRSDPDDDVESGDADLGDNGDAAFTPAPALARPPDPVSGPPGGFAGSPPPPPPPPPPAAFGSPATTAPQQPLRVIEAAWASRGGSTPVGTTGVPDGTLPVGTRLGQIDKASFVRLAGTASTLELVEDADGGRAPAGEPSVQACVVLDSGWEEAEAMPLGDAPEWDDGACVEGIRGDDGTWTFAVGALGDPTDRGGYALVPGPDAPVDFQVAFAR